MCTQRKGHREEGGSRPPAKERGFKETSPAARWPWTSGLQSWEKKRISAVQLPGLWLSVGHPWQMNSLWEQTTP